MGITLNMVVAISVIVLSVYNLLIALSIILTSGVGKNGSTVAVRSLLSYPPSLYSLYDVSDIQDTSVLSPMVSVVVQVPMVVFYAWYSPNQLLHTHCILFLTAFTFPIVKSIIHMVVISQYLLLTLNKEYKYFSCYM